MRSLVANFLSWALCLFPPSFQSSNLARFCALCRCLLFFRTDRCFNSHQAIVRCDLTRHTRCVWSKVVSWVMSSTKATCSCNKTSFSCLLLFCKYTQSCEQLPHLAIVSLEHKMPSSTAQKATSLVIIVTH